jgi:hypothetical protein
MKRGEVRQFNAVTISPGRLYTTPLASEGITNENNPLESRPRKSPRLPIVVAPLEMGLQRGICPIPLHLRTEAAASFALTKAPTPLTMPFRRKIRHLHVFGVGVMCV